MADQKISELTEIASLDDTDLIPVVDTSASETKKITKANLLGSFLTAETDPVFGASEAVNFVAGDKSKLDGIEASADVTDATNVDAAGATMNADTDVSANGWVVDEDAMTSNLASKVPTQQSVKAYVDTNTLISAILTRDSNATTNLTLSTATADTKRNLQIYGTGNTFSYSEVALGNGANALQWQLGHRKDIDNAFAITAYGGSGNRWKRFVLPWTGNPIFYKSGQQTYGATLDLDTNLTAGRTFAFPDKTGTFAIMEAEQYQNTLQLGATADAKSLVISSKDLGTGVIINGTDADPLLSGSGGALSFTAGAGGDAAVGGNVSITGGQGGKVDGSTAGNGGNVIIVGGYAGAGAVGGDVEITTGYADNAANHGKIKLGVTDGDGYAILDLSGITEDRNITVPDASGTIALQSASTGTFTTNDGKTVTVTNGIITGIV